LIILTCESTHLRIIK